MNLKGNDSHFSIKIPNISGIIAIQNYGSSGSLFLQSLFDGHPNILSMPALHARLLLNYWDLLFCESDQFICSFLIKECSYWFYPENLNNELGLKEMGPNMDEPLSVEPNLFQQAFLYCMKNVHGYRRKKFLVSVFIAYNYALGRLFDDNMWILFPIHSLHTKRAWELVSDFRNVKFIHTIRDPLQLHISMIKHFDQRNISENYWRFNHFKIGLNQLLNGVAAHISDTIEYKTYGDEPYIENYRNESLAVKLEDLHSQLESTLKDICGWIEIPFDNSLKQSTFNGKQWWNRPSSIRISGADKNLTAIHNKEELPIFDRIRLQGIYIHRYKTWEYDYPKYISTKTFQYIFPILLLMPFSSKRKTEEDITSERARFFYKLTDKSNRLPDAIRTTAHRYQKKNILKLNREQYRQLLGFEETPTHFVAEKTSLGFDINSEKSRKLKKDSKDSFEYNYVFEFENTRDILKEFLVDTAMNLASIFANDILTIHEYISIRKLLYKSWLKNQNGVPKLVRLLKFRNNIT